MPMKKIITLLSVAFTAVSFAQSVTTPTVEGTYLPVGGTKFNQVWDTIPGGTMVPPTTGTNQVWNYSAAFNNNSGTYTVSTQFAYEGAKFHLFDTLKVNNFEGQAKDTVYPTHSLFVTIPYKQSLADSLEQYILVTKKGLYNLGGFSHKKAYDSTLYFTKPELYIPYSVTYLDSKVDTSRYYGYAKKFFYNGNYYKVKLQGAKTKTLTCNGYGTLQAPNATYNDVLLATSKIAQKDTFFIDLNNDGNYYNDAFLPFYPGYTVSTTSMTENYFIRNNTFGSSYLMYLAGNANNSAIGYGWYIQPVDTGTIKGTVFTNSLAVSNATAGVAYLYRENSNFAKNDILATSPLDANGNYQFNSIPYGLYRIAVRPDTTVYHNAFITYAGDATDWLQPQTITISTFTTPLYIVGDIHLQYYPAPAGQGTVTGNCPGCKVLSLNLPGVGLVVKKKPGNAPIIGGASDSNGNYTFSNMDNGQYEIFVDRPGLYNACTYTFEINGATNITGLTFAEGTTSISATNTVTNAYNTCLGGGGGVTTGLSNQVKSNNQLVSAYPNPYQSQTTVELNLTANDHVLLEVFNSLGQKVQTLDNSTKQAGEYKYQFSAKNLNLSNGLYFLKLKTNHLQQVIKLIEQ